MLFQNIWDVVFENFDFFFANGPGDLGSIPGRVIPKTQKMVLDASLLNTQHYKVRIKGKVEQSREGVAPSPTHWCSSYRKGSLRVTLDYGRQLYFTIYSFSKTVMYAHTHTHTYTHTQKQTHTHTHTHTHTYIHIYIYISEETWPKRRVSFFRILKYFNWF